jgi:N-acetylmuramic acid 6-phosphate etherase
MRRGAAFFISGRYQREAGVLDASEYLPHSVFLTSVVIGLIAGGETALRKAVESAEMIPQRHG